MKIHSINDKRLAIKLHNGNNCYYIENKTSHESYDSADEKMKDLFTSDSETPLRQQNLKTPKIKTL